MRPLKLLLNQNFSLLLCLRRNTSKLTNQQAIKHRSKIFEEEKNRQLSEIERIEKIEVKCDTGVDNQTTTLLMNKNLSTPLNCAMHISELLCTRSVVALVNNQPWDMHRPLQNDCEIKFLHFKDEDPKIANNAYWRSCSFVLGYLLETSFKEDFFVELCSFPPPNIKSGSFVYDAKLNIPNWKPKKDELRCLSISASKLHKANYKFEHLKIKKDVAEEMFKYNKLKLEQIPSVLSSSEDKGINVYRIGDYVDISKGPMISNTSLIGRFEVTGIFDVENSKYGTLQRIQGVSIPSQLHLHYWTFNLLTQRASKLNTSDINFGDKPPKEQLAKPPTTQDASQQAVSV